jgi:hypothetical protein
MLAAGAWLALLLALLGMLGALGALDDAVFFLVTDLSFCPFAFLPRLLFRNIPLRQRGTSRQHLEDSIF